MQSFVPGKTPSVVKDNKLDKFPTYFCYEFGDKIGIAVDHRVAVMIDDKLQVLKTFNENIIKIWFCDDQKKIDGMRKYQPELLNSVRLAYNWNQVLDIIDNM